MPILLKGQLRPKNASCTWSQDCGFWRSLVNPSLFVCHAHMRLRGTVYAGPTNDIPSVVGGFLGATKIGFNCAGSSSYVSLTGTDILIDFWKALADGAWTSSTVLEVYGRHNLGLAGNGTITAEAPHTSTAKTVAMSAGGGCPTTKFGDLTVFDDGTFTFA